MFAGALRINASTRAGRIAMTSSADRAITESGGWISDFKQFSNISICITFEIAAKNIEKLHLALKAAGLGLSKQSDETLSKYAGLQDQAGAMPEEAGAQATLQITFLHDEPDLKRPVLAIPG